MEKRYDIEIKAFGSRIRKLREEREMSQLDLELQSGINRTEISRIENGLKNIEFMTLIKLAIAFDVSLEDLFIN